MRERERDCIRATNPRFYNLMVHSSGRLQFRKAV
jgi:hypothetical protein